MQITAENKQGILVVRLKGASLDAKEATPFLQRVMHLLDEDKSLDLILDLKELDFIDGAGLGTFRTLFKKLADQNKKMALVHVERSVRTVLEVVSLDKVFPIFSTLQEAVKSWKP